MSDTSGGGNVGIGIYADPADVARLEKVIENAIESGLKGGFSSKNFTTGSDAIIKELKKLQAAMVKMGQTAKEAFSFGELKDIVKALNPMEQSVAQLAEAYKRLGISQNNLGRTIYRNTIAESDANRQRKIETQQVTTIAQQQEARLTAVVKAELRERTQAERAALDTAGREQREQIENRITRTKAAAKIIVDIERGLGAAIAGIARTATSALSRTASGISGGLGALFKRETKEIQTNNSVFKSVLNDRTTVLDKSLTKQERLVRESVTKQSAQFTRLNTITSKGIAGAVTGRGIGIGIGGLIAGVGLGNLFKEGFKDATNYTEQLSKTQIVFGDFQKDIIAFAKTSVNTLGVTNAKALESLGTFGNLFKAFGFGAKETKDASVAFTQLASDMASFSNTTVEAATTALNSGLVGESEPLKRYGVILNDVTLKAKALELGLYSGKGVLDSNAKAQAAYALILEKTAIQQGNFALTADEGANAQKRFGSAVAQFFSTTAGLLKGVVTSILLVGIPAFTALGNLVSGDNLSAGMNALRDGIKGVAIALGVLLAAKGAVEVVTLLGAAAKLALTPFGLLVVSVTAIGAAIAILLPRSEAFRNVIDGVVEKAKELGGTVKDFVVTQLGRLANFIVDTAIPAVIKFGQFVGEKLVTAFRASMDFIKGTAIPAIKSFAQYIADKVVPIVVEFGQTVQRWFGLGLEAVKEFWHFVEPFIRPAIEGFKDLGSAIAGAFSGDFSGLLGGLGSAASGVGSVASKIGSNILGALKPLGTTILNFLKDIFSVKSLGSIAGGLLDLIEAIGRFLGSHVDFVVEWAAKIGLALAAAAVIIGGRFLIGFVDGLRESLPRLAGDIGNLFLDALKGAFSGDIFSIALLGGSALVAFKLFGKLAASSFATSFKAGIGGGVGFGQGLFGTVGSGIGANAFGPTIAGAKASAAEVQGLTNKLRIMGSPTVYDGTTAGLRAIRAESKLLERGLSSAQLAGLTMRDKLSGAFKAVGVAASGAVGIGKGVGIGITQGFGQGAAQIKSSFTKTMDGLRTIAGQQGKSLGVYIGKGVGIGLASAVGGGLAGNAAGKAGVSPLMAGLTTGLTAGLLTTNPLIGVAAGSAAALGAAFGAADKAAADMKSRIDQLAGSLKGTLKTALEDGTLSVLTFKGALEGETGSDIGAQILGSFNSDTLAQLKAAGVTISEITTAIKNNDIGSIADQFKLNDGAIQLSAYTELTAASKAYQHAIRDLNNESAILNETTSTGTNIFITAAQQAVNPLGVAIGALSTEIERTNPRLADLGVRASSAGEAARNGTGSFQTFSGAVSALRDAARDTQATEAMTQKIADLDTEVSDLTASLDLLIQQIAIAFGSGGALDAAVSQGVIDIQAAVTTLAGIDPASGLAIDKANAAAATTQIAEEISTVVTAGIKDGSITGLDDAKTAVNPLLEAAMQAIAASSATPEVKAQLTAQVAALFTDGFAAAEPTILAAIETARLASETALSSLQLTSNGPTAYGQQIGKNFADGIVAGMAAGTITVAAGAAALAKAAQLAAAKALGISSPSKVMMEIGRFAGEGLAIGLAESTSGLGDVITNAVDTAVSKATDAAEKARLSLQATFAGLFDFSLGNTGLGGQISSGLTNVVQGFLEAFDANVSSVFGVADAAAKAASGEGPALTNAQLNILGESLFSLDPNDIIGSSNIAALTQALTAVQDAGKALLASGSSPTDVANTLKAYTQQIKDQGVALGLSASGIDSLIGSLGLAPSALDAFVASTAAATLAMADAAKAAAALSAGQAPPSPVPLADQVRLAVALGQPVSNAQLAVLTDEEILAYLKQHPEMLMGQKPEFLLEVLRGLYGGGKKPDPYVPPGTSDPSSPSPSTPDPAEPDPLGSLPSAGTNIFYVYPPTNDPAAIALGIANHLAATAYIP